MILNPPKDSSQRWCFLGGLGVVVALSACRPPAQESPPQEVPAVEEGYFTGAGGLRFFYRRVGGGMGTAVYLHGGHWNMSDRGYELDDLATGRSLIAFDQRSGGQSELVNDPDLLTADYYLQDLEALPQHFALERMSLIDQS